MLVAPVVALAEAATEVNSVQCCKQKLSEAEEGKAGPNSNWAKWVTSPGPQTITGSLCQ